MTSYQIKGSTLKSKLLYVEHHFGPDARAMLAEDLSQKGLPQVLDASWYDYDLHVGLLETIAKTHFAGDLSRLAEVGAYSAERALASTYQTFRSHATLGQCLKSLMRLHGLFYNQGGSRVELGSDDKSATIVHYGKPQVSSADLFVAQGFYAKVVELFGCRDGRCVHAPLPDGARFQLSWTSMTEGS